MSARVLIVEDDLALRTALVDAFKGEGYDVLSAADGGEATELVFGRRFDCLVLDLMLPIRGGLELLRELREEGLKAPVLILTAKGDENDRVLGLELGADDYVTKPFSLRELIARVKALLRRAGAVAADGADSTGTFFIGDAEIDLDAYHVVRNGTREPLSPKEAAMLQLLRREMGKAVSRARFLQEVWGGDAMVGNRTVDTHMLNLRKKVEIDPKAPRHLLTVHGVGYRLVQEEEA